MKKTLILTILLFLAACSNGEQTKVGYIGPLSGDAAILGIEAVNAIELAFEGTDVQLIAEDDQFLTANSLKAYEKLVNVDKVEYILTSSYGGLFAIAEQTKQDGVIVIDVLDCDEKIAQLPDNVFCVAKASRDLADVIADFAIEQDVETVGILHSTVDEFMPSIAQMFKQQVEQDNVEVQLEPYEIDTNDFKTQLLKLQDKDAIVYLGYDEVGIAIKQAKELGIKNLALTIPSVATTPSIQESSGNAIDGIFFSFYAPLEENVVANEMYQEYEAKFGREPIVYVATDYAFDAATMLLDAMKTKNPQEAMYNIENFPGVSGTLDMQPDGRVSGIKVRLYQLENLVPKYVSG